jgi:fructosamine-3-kinase
LTFVKKNSSRYADHLLCEAHGLEALNRALTGVDIDVPEVIHVDQNTLTLPLIQAVSCTAGHWKKLGEGLAAMHAQPQSRFGFDADNYIGLNPQPNAFNDSWGDFFLRRRLEYQVGLITERRRREQYSNCLGQRGRRLREFLDAQSPRPSLVHGDLWNGNVICGDHGRVWLIDPAAYYGDAEVDLAMTEMFGGFPTQFYAAYRAHRPEPRNWAQKKEIYNLYHYLNHLNLFGQAYLGGCDAGFAVLEKI